MLKLRTVLQEKIEQYIEKQRIHLRSYAEFDRSKFKDKEELEREVEHGKLILTNSIANFLLNKEHIGKYIVETRQQDNMDLSRLNLDVFVFSGDQLKLFVEMIKNHRESRILH